MSEVAFEVLGFCLAKGHTMAASVDNETWRCYN